MDDVHIEATPISKQAVGLLTHSPGVGLGRLPWAQGWTGWCTMCQLRWNSFISIRRPCDPVTAEPSMQGTFPEKRRGHRHRLLQRQLPCRLVRCGLVLLSAPNSQRRSIQRRRCGLLFAGLHQRWPVPYTDRLPLSDAC